MAMPKTMAPKSFEFHDMINFFSGKITRDTKFGNDYIIKVIDHVVGTSSRR